MVQGNFSQFISVSVSERYMQGCPSDVLVHKAVAFIERTIQDKMDMRVHQGESQDNHTISLDSDIDPVHSCDEIQFIVEQHIDGIAIRAEMPTVPDADVLSFDECEVESEIGNDLPEQFLIYLHLHIQRRLWLLKHKDSGSQR